MTTTQATYSYRARDASGEVVTGTLVANDQNEVCTRLRAEGKFVLEVCDRPMREGATVDSGEVRRSEAAKRVKRDDVIAFCQQLAVMLETGVPLTEALDAFCAQAARKDFRVVLDSVRDEIYAGEQFSTAMSRWPRVFPPMMISLMKASEASGTMSMMLGRIGEYLAKERATARQIRGALGYPMFMMICGISMTAFLVTFVLPRFAKIYESRAASLPTPTRVVLAISNFLTTYWMYYLPAALVIGVSVFLLSRQRAGRRAFDWVRLNAPVLKTLFGQLYLTRACRTMATLLGAGVNLLDIIDLCRGVTANAYYDDLWNSVEAGVRDGRQVSDSMASYRFIPPNVASMIASGERSGRLAEVMERIASFAEEELDVAVKRVTSYIEPVMIILMGLVVGGLAVALLMPIFSMGRVMTGTG